ncbi:MAG TPA: hypothetical protein VI756_18320 [Blastocatellia bacterium]
MSKLGRLARSNGSSVKKRSEQERPPRETADVRRLDASGAELNDNDLFDDYDLAESIAKIIRQHGVSADEFTMYSLIILDGLANTPCEQVKRTIRRSVEFAFLFRMLFVPLLSFIRWVSVGGCQVRYPPLSLYATCLLLMEARSTAL